MAGVTILAMFGVMMIFKTVIVAYHFQRIYGF